MFGGYDQRTGALQRTYTMQGFSDDSTWARGQAWAIYGFTTAYRYTQDPRYLETAHRTADWFTGHLPPDRVPYWDFDVPQAPPQPRDTSAAAIAASALLELSQLDPAPRRRATSTPPAGCSPRCRRRSTCRGTPRSRSILIHGTQNLPEGQQDSGIMFGDYYFVEALNRWERQVGPSAQLTQGCKFPFTDHPPSTG